MCPCKQLDLHTARLDSFAAYKCIAASMACWIFYSPLGHPLSFLLTLNAFPNMSVGRIHHFRIAHEKYENELMAKFNRKVREIKDMISQSKYGTEGLKLCLHHSTG